MTAACDFPYHNVKSCQVLVFDGFVVPCTDKFKCVLYIVYLYDVSYTATRNHPHILTSLAKPIPDRNTDGNWQLMEMRKTCNTAEFTISELTMGKRLGPDHSVRTNHVETVRA